MVHRIVGVLDIGIGNLTSLKSAFKYYGHTIKLIREPKDFNRVDFLVIAGVGSFVSAMNAIGRNNLLLQLNEYVLSKKKPILGICLGMQIFSEVGYEGGISNGLGWFAGKVCKLFGNKIPHMGWNSVESESSLFRNLRSMYFYFMHSYHFIPNCNDNTIGQISYGGRKIVSSVQRDNIVGVQFHPEKSQMDGLRFIKNILDFYG